MARNLTTTVHVADENGTVHVFGPDRDGGAVPGWAEKAITNPHVWEGEDSGDQAVTFADPGNSGPSSVEMTDREDTRPAAKDADSAPGGGETTEVPAGARGTRQRSGR